MDIDTLISAASRGSATSADLRAIAQVRGCSIHDLCDQFAKEVAERYLSSLLSWEAGDTAMNHLYGLAYGSDDLGVGEFAWGVYLAFDEGEYIHSGEDPDLDGEPRTRKLLMALLAGRPAQRAGRF